MAAKKLHAEVTALQALHDSRIDSDTAGADCENIIVGPGDWSFKKSNNHS